MKFTLLLLFAIALGLCIAYIDARPNWDDTGITAGMLLLASFLMGTIDPARAWIYAIAIGLWIPLHGLIQGGSPWILVILAFPFAGAYAGAFLRKLGFHD